MFMLIAGGHIMGSKGFFFTLDVFPDTKAAGTKKFGGAWTLFSSLGTIQRTDPWSSWKRGFWDHFHWTVVRTELCVEAIRSQSRTPSTMSGSTCQITSWFLCHNNGTKVVMVTRGYGTGTARSMSSLESWYQKRITKRTLRNCAMDSQCGRSYAVMNPALKWVLMSLHLNQSLTYSDIQRESIKMRCFSGRRVLITLHLNCTLFIWTT